MTPLACLHKFLWLLHQVFTRNVSINVVILEMSTRTYLFNGKGVDLDVDAMLRRGQRQRDLEVLGDGHQLRGLLCPELEVKCQHLLEEENSLVIQ